MIFNDEKKYNFDGQDSLSCYWRDLENKPEIFCTKNQGLGLIMVLGAVSYSALLSIVEIEGNLDSKHY